LFIRFSFGDVLAKFGQKFKRRFCAWGLEPEMPRTINGESRRQSVRVPVPMIEEIDKIVKASPGLHYNRQQFIESAIREKIEKTQLFKTRNSNTSS
jgi:hypothetical protein